MTFMQVVVLIVTLGGQNYGIEWWYADQKGAWGDCFELAAKIQDRNHVRVQCRRESWPAEAESVDFRME